MALMRALAAAAIGLAGVEAITAVVEWVWPASLGGRVYWRGRRDRRAVALTFDDGPTPYTERVLDLLRAAGAPATFFAIGQRVERLPATARRVVAEGHEIGNHTYSLAIQPLPWRFSLPTIAGEVARAQEAIAAVTGVRPRYFRTPAGQIGRNLWREVRRHNLAVVHGALPVAPPRWSARLQLRLLERQIAPGAILILHDGLDSDPMSAAPEATVALLPALLAAIRERGFDIVPLGVLLGHDGMAVGPRPP
ncbi:MAG: polysaccharide deacetylase family protein [Chloroflexota bacterium]|nr:polysaccharide deacetylase family protein [Dehalococcoidia bacterium]MDW8255218.1 polysaccharide deacetylase family protein [Chloroflexota bacterium]